jgi:hypothetical protein
MAKLIRVANSSRGKKLILCSLDLNEFLDKGKT